MSFSRTQHSSSGESRTSHPLTPSLILAVSMEPLHSFHSNKKLNRQHSKENTVKPVLSGHSKIDKTKVLKVNGSLMKVESIADAECPLGAFCNTFDLH